MTLPQIKWFGAVREQKPHLSLLPRGDDFLQIKTIKCLLLGEDLVYPPMVEGGLILRKENIVSNPMPLLKYFLKKLLHILPAFFVCLLIICNRHTEFSTKTICIRIRKCMYRSRVINKNLFKRRFVILICFYWFDGHFKFPLRLPAYRQAGFIIFFMCAYESYVHYPKIIVNCSYQPIIISFDVENNSIIRQNTCCLIIPNNIKRFFPLLGTRENFLPGL